MKKVFIVSVFCFWYGLTHGAEEQQKPRALSNPYYKCTNTITHPVAVTALAVHQGDLFYADDNGVVGYYTSKLGDYNLRSYTCNTLFRANGTAPKKLLFWDNKLVCSDGSKYRVRITDIESGKFNGIDTTMLNDGETTGMKVTSFAIDNNMLFVGTQRGKIYLFDLRTQECIEEMGSPFPRPESVNDIIPFNNEEIIAVGGDGTWSCYNIREGLEKAPESIKDLTAHAVSVVNKKAFIVTDSKEFYQSNTDLNDASVRYIAKNKDWKINTLMLGDEILFTAEDQMKKNESKNKAEIEEYVVRSQIKLFDIKSGMYIDALEEIGILGAMCCANNMLYTARSQSLGSRACTIFFYEPKDSSKKEYAKNNNDNSVSLNLFDNNSGAMR